eukprot:TRINITY_DN4287_c0_g1_i1.p1 TRINITY_DN4287_c0_g1~~TRINITY_DN4287_c0_g1_i1.p1  ORF type:complete len:347 (-),score=40.42 TRINITY_DN4287_c0_g1_i1:75-1115(-)
MGACASSQSKQNRKINHLLSKEKRKYQEEVKILLLGSGESGKSTVFKQMKAIEGSFSPSELSNYKYIVFANCITQMKCLISAAKKLEKPLEDDNQAAAETIYSLPTGGDAWNKEVATLIEKLWKDKGIQETFELRDKEFQLNDSAQYFFENIHRFSQDDYNPSIDDVLRARVRTSGIEEAEFVIEDFSFRMFDVGGQRSERRKWIHCFENVTSVIFCASLSEYNQRLREDDEQNRMLESIHLFEEVCNSAFFENVMIILFLNKVDIFKEKIEKIDLNVCFDNYTGGLNFENASNFIKARYSEKNHSVRRSLFTHLTCAVNRDNIEFVFKCVRETIMKSILKQVAVI